MNLLVPGSKSSVEELDVALDSLALALETCTGGLHVGHACNKVELAQLLHLNEVLDRDLSSKHATIASAEDARDAKWVCRCRRDT